MPIEKITIGIINVARMNLIFDSDGFFMDFLVFFSVASVVI
ncbi:MAG: hypothetical protein R3255_08545 [Candidatus Lokiarchaeia archaeon]|nr:hypothetical protein [Candidatus Lokiarchaeia archaeon]